MMENPNPAFPENDILGQVELELDQARTAIKILRFACEQIILCDYVSLHGEEKRCTSVRAVKEALEKTKEL